MEGRMVSSAVLLLVVSLLLAGVASDVLPTDPCYITPAQLKGSIRAANMQRALCEGSNFKHASCSNYWAAIDEVRLLTSKFQRCQENIDSTFRAWVYGTQTDDAEIPGAFAYQGVLDRIYVNDNTTALLSLLANLTASTTNLAETLFQRNKASLLAAHTNETSLTITHVDALGDATRNLASSEEQNTRAFVDTTENALRVLVNDQESASRTNVSNNEIQDRTLASSEYDHARRNQSAESSLTRSEDIAQTEATIATNLQEETSTRQEEDSQSTQTRTHHDSVLATTKSIVTTEIDSQHSQIRADVATEAINTRADVDSSAQHTQAAVSAEEASTIAFSVAQIDANEQQTQNAEQAAQQVIVQAVADQTLITQNDEVSARTQIVNAVAAAEAANQAAETAAEQDFANNVHYDEATTRDFFNSTALPEMISATNGEQAALDAESATMSNILIHVNLASTSLSFFCRFAYIDVFNRPDGPFLLKTKAAVNDTVSYYTAKYGASHVGYAASYLATGNSRYTSGDYNGALLYWRKAYKDATCPN